METVEWRTGQPLTDDYINRSEKASGLYDYDPWSKGAWSARADWLDRERPFGADREGLAEALRAFNRKAGNAPEALQGIESLRDARTLCVVGGQQASLFTGPLMVVYKAITIIQAARQSAEALNRPVVPVFWIAGEDHDFDEVNHTYFLSADLRVEKMKVERPDDRRTSVSQTLLSREQWESALAQLDASLMPTEFKEGVLAEFRFAAESSDTLVDGFAKLLAGLFGKYGLVLLDSDDPALRRLEGPMFHTLIERSSAIGEALLRNRARLQELGYEPQADGSENSLNLFVFDERGERTLLFADASGQCYTDRKGERRFSKEQLLDWAQTAPERLSNNVMTRPLMQDYLLPVLGTVLGPAEIAYWGLTQQAFHTLGMRMPILWPRLGFTIVEGTAQKNMQKLGLTLDDVRFRLEERRQAWLEAQDRWQLKDRFADVKNKFRELYEPIVSSVAEINPGLQKLGETNLGKILEQIDFFGQKAEDGLRSQNESGLRQFARIGQSVLPSGKLQERVFNISAYLNKYGSAWLDELVQTPHEIDGKHRICYM